MWSAFMNGSVLHGGGGAGGAGGGYVPSQGWEFVPCSRMDRADNGRGKNRNPLRRVSSPATVFSHLQESQLGVSSAAAEVGSGTPFELLRGHMWPGPEPEQRQQTQHMRLKKKLEDLKKQHVQDKEVWMREKEALLREVADIQGGENRRILLDLKTVLEEVQLEVKREEEKRSELQLQYTRDRCSWELEKTELKCRIAQLETKEGTVLISGGVHSAAGSGTVVLRSVLDQDGGTSTFCREREEQRRLLADTHSTAMDLRCRLEHNERDWSREKAELLDRFDLERKEWEGQLKDMQKKIEELYYEVRAKREGTRRGSRGQNEEDASCRLSIHSTSIGSSLLGDNCHFEQLSNSSSHSEPSRHSHLPSFGHNKSTGGCTDGQSPIGFQNSLCEYNPGGQFTQNDLSQPEPMDASRCRGTWSHLSVTEDVDISEPDAVFHGAPGGQTNYSIDNENNVRPQDNLPRSEQSNSSYKKNATALNAALKEIARVSEELCSYQDEIRKKSSDRSNRFESQWPPEESEILFGYDKTPLVVEETPCDLSQIYDDLLALEKENWTTSSSDNTRRVHRGLRKSSKANLADPVKEAQTSPTVLSDADTDAPPIPPRLSSWNLSNTAQLDTELHIPESPVATVRRCHSPCVLVDRKCSSPSIVRKFGAMLQENEGKVLIDGVVTSCSVPTNSKCNVGCCHNCWSCDTIKASSKPATHGTVQKSFSEVNILTAGKDLSSDFSPAVGKLKDLQMPPIVMDLPVDPLFSSCERSPASLKLQSSKRNTRLEQKTAEFNRTLFQAEMGRGIEEQERFTVTDVGSVGCQAVVSAACASDEVLPPWESTTGIIDVPPEATLYESTSKSTFHKVQNKQMRSDPEGQEVKTNMSFEQPHIGLREETTITSQSPAYQSEVKQKFRKRSSLSRNTEPPVATEAVVTEPVNTQLGQNVDSSSSNSENPPGAKPQAGRVCVSLQQLSAENKQRQMTPLGHGSLSKHGSVPSSQYDSLRPVPRMMTDHPWKPLTLAAYPRPEGSRSNYGAVERILKNYESAALAQKNHTQQDEASTSLNFSIRQEETITELDLLDMDPLPLPPSLTITHAQRSSSSSLSVKEMLLLVQENQAFSVSASSVQKTFSRPARPANRRLPTRWASCSPTSSSSPSSTSDVAPSFPLQKHTCTRTFHLETVIN